MTHPDPQKRPSSTTIFYEPVLLTSESKTKAQLQQELLLQRQKNEILAKKLRESIMIIKSYELASTPSKFFNIFFLRNSNYLFYCVTTENIIIIRVANSITATLNSS